MKDLQKCERGAIMVTSIFMVLFLVAGLYMVIGLGRTLSMKEGMQDAADAAAYSSAIFNARGMNLIVFINLVMAALISVLIAIRVAQTFMIVIAGALGAMSVVSAGMASPAAAMVSAQAAQMGAYYNQLKPVIENILNGLHTAQEAVSVVVPYVAMTRGMLEAATHHEPADGAFAIPGSYALPVESDDYSRLCEEGAESLVDLAFIVFPEPVREFMGFVGDAAGGIAQATSQFLCGDGGGPSPVHTQKLNRQLPRHPEEDECQDNDTARCMEMRRFMDNAQPLGEHGECREDCEFDGPYEWMARRARLDCIPGPGRILENYVWQERTVVADFEFNGVSWVKSNLQKGELFLMGRDDSDTPKLENDSGEGPPCGFGGSIDEEWNTDSGFLGAAEPRTVCEEEPQGLPEVAEIGEQRTASYREVVRVFSCTQRTTQHIELASGDQAIGGSGSESRSPHKVEEDIDLGDEAFQIRAIAFGDKPDPGEAKKGVVLVDRSGGSVSDRWKAPPLVDGVDTKFLFDLAANAGRLSVAQAEFYFHADEGEKARDWMWRMKWTARLRHFHFPTEEEQQESEERNQGVESKVSQFGGIEPGATSEGACEAAGGDNCGSKVGAVSLLEGIVRH